MVCCFTIAFLVSRGFGIWLWVWSVRRTPFKESPGSEIGHSRSGRLELCLSWVESWIPVHFRDDLLTPPEQKQSPDKSREDLPKWQWKMTPVSLKIYQPKKNPFKMNLKAIIIDAQSSTLNCGRNGAARADSNALASTINSSTKQTFHLLQMWSREGERKGKRERKREMPTQKDRNEMLKEKKKHK